MGQPSPRWSKPFLKPSHDWNEVIAMVQSMGIDIGGSGFRIGIFDCTTGVLQSDFIQRHHTNGVHPNAILPNIRSEIRGMNWNGIIGIGFPGAVEKGVVKTAPNLGKAWIGLDLSAEIGIDGMNDIVAMNDADAVGTAEVTHGAGKSVKGTVLTLTVGTGIGTTIHRHGTLEPNLEYGLKPHPFKEGSLEDHASGRARAVNGLTLRQWVDEFQVALECFYEWFQPDTVIVSGGITEHWGDLGSLFSDQFQLSKAIHGQHAGALGAAIQASKLTDSTN